MAPRLALIQTDVFVGLASTKNLAALLSLALPSLASLSQATLKWLR